MGQPTSILAGSKFGRLTVVQQNGIDKQRSRRWLCLCDCGNQTIVPTGSLRKGRTKSCGCLKQENSLTMFVTHGQYRTPEYKIWLAMKGRCRNPKNKGFPSYGGRGISVCERWNYFSNFIADMGNRPSPNLSLDRINNDLGYSAENCRWATRTQQIGNRRCSRVVEYQGQTMPVAQAYRLSGSSANKVTVYRRLRQGWPIEDALTAPKFTVYGRQ